MIITLDGPAASGKSTLSRALAKKIHFHFLDTGAMYRAATLVIQENNIDIAHDDAVRQLLADTQIRLSGDMLFINGQDRSRDIRSPEIDHAVSEISALPVVRDKLVDLQREVAANGNYIAEGRDMGSVVFPDARFKFYLDASPEERARRRFEQNQERGIHNQSYEELLSEIIRRDQLDSSREIAPLVIPEGAVLIDTTSLSIQDILDRMVRIVKNEIG